MAVVATAAVVIVLAGFVVVAVVGRNRDGGIPAFGACITQSRFLILVPDAHVDSFDDRVKSFSEIIKDRARGGVVGEVTTDRSAFRLGGAAAANGRYFMSTATPLGRDATVIARCWGRFFPIA